MATARQPVQTVQSREFWTEFIALYRSLPALWDMRNPLYKSRDAKDEAYDLMVQKLCEVMPGSDREDVQRKVNIFRTNYRRECMRISESKAMGKQYKTTLWYFELLNFLRCQETRREKKPIPDDEKCILISGSRKRKRSGAQRVGGEKTVSTAKPFVAIEQIQKVEEMEDFLEDYENESTQFEHYDDENEIKTEETMVDVQYSDEKSFQEEFQNKFYTLPLKQSIRGEGSRENSELKDSTVFIQLSNTDANTHEILEEIEQEEELCGKAQFVEAALEKDSNHKEKKRTRKSRNVQYMATKTTQTQTTNCIHEAEHKVSEATEILAKSWAIQYDELSNEQKIHARKAIADILFEGCMGKLGHASRIIRNGVIRISDSYFTTEQQQQDDDDDDEENMGDVNTYAHQMGDMVEIEESLFEKMQ